MKNEWRTSSDPRPHTHVLMWGNGNLVNGRDIGVLTVSNEPFTCECTWMPIPDDGWIDSWKELPKAWEQVLARCPGIVDVCFVDNHGQWWDDGGTEISDEFMEEWQPLPNDP